MQTALRSQPTTAQSTHKEIMEETKANIRKRENTLQETSTKKLRNLTYISPPQTTP